MTSGRPDAAAGPTSARATGAARSAAPPLSLRRCLAIVVAVHVALIVAFARDPRHGLRVTLFDDAMVSLTYARNAARGLGFVWSAPPPPVEGYTNPLWTALMAAVEVAAPDGWAPAMVVAISSAVLVGAAAIAHAVVRRLSPADAAAPVLACLAVGLAYPLLFWSLRGMEVGLVTLGILATLLVADRDEVTAARVATLVGLAAGCVLTRSDSLVPLVALAGGLIVARRGRALVPAAVIVGTSVATLGLHTLLRDSWYGDPLPNTYYLKLEGVTLATRLGRGALTSVPFVLTCLVPTVVVVALGARRDHERVRRLAPTLAPAAALVAYSAYVGGDAWEQFGFANRYLGPALALLLIAAATCFGDAWRRSPTACTAAGVVACVGVELWFALRRAADLPYAELDGAPALRLVVAAGVALLLLAQWRRARDGGAVGPSRLVATGLLVLLASSAAPAVVGVAGGQHVRTDLAARRAGEIVGALTSDDASIAVVWAGNLPYWSDRSSVDLLGKADPVVAHGTPRALDEWRPGHDRWDYGYSVGELRPDLVVQLWQPSADDLALLEDLGYRPVAPRDDAVAAELSELPFAWLFVRDGSDRVDLDALEPTAWPAPTSGPGAG